MNKHVKILVASHKPYWMPQDSLYAPIQVGAAGKPSIEGFIRDDEGENISEKNPHYSELTALYWAWKNLDADYIGLVQYRRQFKGSGERGILSARDVEKLLSRADIVVAKKRNYFIKNIRDHYGKTFSYSQLDVLRLALKKCSPEVLPYFDEFMSGTRAHMFNMMIMRKDLLDEYCAWLFPILFEVESKIDFEGMTAFEARAVGRLSERLLDPWLQMKGLSFAECPVQSMEPVGWPKKIRGFVSAMFFGKKYTESF